MGGALVANVQWRFHQKLLETATRNAITAAIRKSRSSAWTQIANVIRLTT